MGKINKEIEQYEKKLEEYKELIHLTHVAEINREPEKDSNKEEKEKQKYCDRIFELRKKAAGIENTLKDLYATRREYGLFYAEDIGKLIADVMTKVECVPFVYKEVDYKRGCLGSDMYEDIGPADSGKVCIITNKTHDYTIEEDDLTDGDFARDEKTIFLATRGFKFPSYTYNGKEYTVQKLHSSNNDLSFYSSKYQIATKSYDYIYEMIDMLIERKEIAERRADPDDYVTFEEDNLNILLGTHESAWLLNKRDYQIVTDYIIHKYRKDRPMTLKRKKDE